MDRLIEKAKELMKLAQQYGVDEVLVTDGKDKIHLGASLGNVQAPVAAPVSTPVLSEDASPVVEDVVEEVASGVQEISSPMAGTYYEAPSPGADPFVKVGSRVTKGQTVCIVEAMKIMNQLKSNYDGVVRRILSKNGDPVTKGQVIIEITEDA